MVQVHVGALESQNERAYQKQLGVFQNSKKVPALKKKKAKSKRWVKDAGLGFPIPVAAREGTYIDKKCPFTGDVSIRGRIFKRHYLHYVSKYNRFEKRHKNIAVHCSPAFEVKDGDIVTLGECRPLSKTVRFNVLKVEPKQIFGSAKKQFCLF